MCTTNKKQEKNSHVRMGIILLVIVLVLYIVSWVLIDCNISDSDGRGTFGDKFGAVNALFSGLAFAGLIYTIILQHDELKYQRQELADNREEMERQTEEFKTQNANLRIQLFETTFFNMVELQQQIVNQLSYKYTKIERAKEYSGDPKAPLIEKFTPMDVTIQGREFFRFAFEEAEHPSGRRPGGVTPKGLSRVMMNEGFKAYEEYYTTSYLDHYFRHLYSILKFIKQNAWLGEAKQYRYASILRATLSRYELVWLFYNGLCEYGQEKLKPLIEEFSMLKNLRPDLLTLCKENLDLMREKGITKDELESKGFFWSDFEFSMTHNVHAPKDQYYIQAFYNKRDIEVGAKHLYKWQSYMRQYGLTL